MSTALAEPPPRARTAAGAQLRTTMAALRLSFTWFGVRKALTHEQKAQAAESFGAQEAFLSAGKKLLDTRHGKFQEVTSVRSRAVSYVKGISLPYPEPGIRLIRQPELDGIQQKLEEFAGELEQAVAQLDAHFDDLKAAARDRLGELFDPTDYPASLRGLFHMEWDFPSVEPPDYLRQLHPDVYRQECRRMQARFEEAVRLTEQAFLAELSGLIGHLTERLSGQVDGRPKVFRDTAVTHLNEFFERFGRLNIGSHAELDALVEQAQEIVQGVAPQQLRESSELRNQVQQQLAQVQGVLDGLLVDRPRRSILRRPT